MSTTGSCVCGQVKLKITKALDQFGACHCTTCQRWTGGPLLSVDCGTDVVIDGGESISVFNSSPWAERAFCNQCGTHLFYRLKESKQMYVPLGLIDHAEKLVFATQIYIDKKPQAYSFAQATKNLTEAELLALNKG